ncbi:MAG: response regulator transcription factor [Alphaproteobacteria bacterium]|nr:response regulator transcription factor [Alphaproteobacteria bacterium]
MKIAIADDHEVFRTGLRHVVKQLADDIEIVEAGSFDEALEQFGKEDHLDLILVDLFMPGPDRLAGVQALCDRFTEVPVVVVSMSDRASDVRQTINLGVRGYIPKTSSADIMLSALKLILSGGVYLPPNVLQARSLQQVGVMPADLAAVSGGAVSALTPRQREVLELVGQGKSNKEIANELGLADGTVKIHMTKIFKTLNVKNRMQAVLAVSRNHEEQVASP